MITINCLVCKKEFSFHASQHRKFCSFSCFIKTRVDKPSGALGKHWKQSEKTLRKRSISQTGEGNNNWKGGRYDYNGKNNKYITLRINKSFVPEHRFIFENSMFRKLKSTEVIHHCDENKKNNNIENLCLFRNDSSHLRFHRFAKRHKIPTLSLKFNQSWLYN